ncbi:MAG: hypothetical protein HND42_02430, partial [Armatimonadetes bacterium]|nr:hypothetical protein [Armatimonadota bacterium]NOG92084.1 hypothetical protein [Armatimonadota bacterium]
MKIILRSTIAAAAVGVLAVGPIGQTPKAENGLLGIKLYDTGVDVVKKFGSPTDIQPVTFGTTATGGGAKGHRLDVRRRAELLDDVDAGVI